MKKIILSFLLIFSAGLSAQDVITFLEDFQNEEVDVLMTAIGDPTMAMPGDLVNYDSDSLPTAAGASGAWYTVDDLLYVTPHDPIVEFNFVARSDSWLEGFLPGNRNYLILPEIEITDESHFFSWKSGFSQGPRFMDGYSVGIIGNMADVEGTYTQLWTAAQHVRDDNDWHPQLYGPEYDFTGCTAPGGPIESQDISDICYFPNAGDGFNGTGYVHADGFTNDEYLGLAGGDPAVTSYVGLLEPHEISLADYIGQTLRLCIRHDSDDDNRITIDDVMVSSGLPVGIDEIVFDRYVSIYPNPVADQFNLNFTQEVKDNAVINILDMKGALVYSEVVNQRLLETVFSIDMTNFETGLYSVSITIDNKESISSNIVKQ